jgi:hypothetical protein
MAEDLTPAQPARPPEPVESLTLRRPVKRRHALTGGTVFPGRFALAYALVAVVIGAAVGGFIVLSDRPVDPEEKQWSAWQPQGDGNERAREIAEHVGPRYRLDTGTQLVGVIASEPTVQNIPVRYVALAHGSDVEDVSILPADDSMSFQLCGLGQRCAIREGQPSLARGRLLHREALELALYTFKYMDDVDSVVAYLPPQRGQQPTLALYFRKDDFNPALERPLEETLPTVSPLTPADVDAQEAQRIGSLTERHLYRYSFQQAPDGSAVLVLQPPAT